MPQRLVVEHFLQEEAQGCLAACAQIALQFLDIRRSQKELNHLLGLTAVGTPASRILRLAQLGVTVTYDSGHEQLISATIEQGLPLIVFIFTGDLPYWQANLRHAVLVVGFDEPVSGYLTPHSMITPSTLLGVIFYWRGANSTIGMP